MQPCPCCPVKERLPSCPFSLQVHEDERNWHEMGVGCVCAWEARLACVKPPRWLRTPAQQRGYNGVQLWRRRGFILSMLPSKILNLGRGEWGERKPQRKPMEKEREGEAVGSRGRETPRAQWREGQFQDGWWPPLPTPTCPQDQVLSVAQSRSTDQRILALSDEPSSEIPGSLD